MKVKRLFAVITAFVLGMSSGIPAVAAASIENTTGEANAEIKASYSAETARETVYHVDISWGSLEYVYGVHGQQVWNPWEHKFEMKGTGDASWKPASEDKTAGTITVTNHSNADIQANFQYTATNGIQAKFDKEQIGLISAEGTAAESAPADTVTLTPDAGTPLNEDNGKQVVIGNVTVTVNEFKKTEDTYRLELGSSPTKEFIYFYKTVNKDISSSVYTAKNTRDIGTDVSLALYKTNNGVSTLMGKSNIGFALDTPMVIDSTIPPTKPSTAAITKGNTYYITYNVTNKTLFITQLY